MTKESLGRAITDAMKAKGVTQKDLAERAGISPANLSLLLNGQRNTGIETVGKVCEALDCHLYLLTEDERNAVSLVLGMFTTFSLDTFLKPLRSVENKVSIDKNR